MRAQWIAALALAALLAPAPAMAADETAPTTHDALVKLDALRGDLESLEKELRLQLKHQGELSGRRLDHIDEKTRLRIETLEKEIAGYKDAAGRQEGRIGDLFSLFTYILPLIIAAMAVGSWFFSASTARKEIEEWLKNNMSGRIGPLLDQAQKDLNALIERETEAAKERFENELNHVTEKKEEILESMERVREAITMQEATHLSDRDKDNIERAAKESDGKSESQLSHGDWRSRGMDAWIKKEYEKAAHAFHMAAASQDATPSQVAEMLIFKGVAQGKAGSPKDAIETYDQLIARYGDATEPAIREQVAKAMRNKGVTQRQAGSPEDAIETYDQVIARYGDSTEPAIRELVAMAMVNKGVAQEKAERYKDAIKTYDQTIERYRDATEPAIREQVSWAHNGKGFTRLVEAKRVWTETGRKDEAAPILETALTDIEKSLADRPDYDIALGNRGYIRFLLDRDGAEADLRRALEIGGEKRRDGELEDADIHPIPGVDEKFKALVETLWAEVSDGKTDED